MKFAIVGCGALGSYYGARLCLAGHETHFLLRSDFEQVRTSGVRILADAGDFTAHPLAARDPSEIGVVDCVIVALKTTANDQFGRLIPPLVGPHTAVLTLQNGLGNEEALAALIPSSKILGGLCFVCLNRESPGVIRHFAHGRILLGEFKRMAEERTHAIAQAFRDSGVPCDVTDHLGRAHWEKLVWNIPFNGLGVASASGWEAFSGSAVEVPVTGPLKPNLPTDLLLADPRWIGLVRELMMEVIAAANAQGFDIPDSQADHEIQRTMEMGAYRASTLVDFERGSPLELDSLFFEPARQAASAGVPTPRLDTLCSVLRSLASGGSRS